MIYWFVFDPFASFSILRWSEDPFQENKFLIWAEGLAKSLDTILIPYHDRDNLFRSEKFQNYLSAQGLLEKKPIHGDDGIFREVESHWEIPSIQSTMEGVVWIFSFSGVIAILMFTPFYLAALCAVSLLPTLIQRYL